MPIPAILIALGAVAGAGGLGSGIFGGVWMKKANDKINQANAIVETVKEKFEKQQRDTTSAMDNLGGTELRILKSFENFFNVFEKIHNRPTMNEIIVEGAEIPKYDPEELKNISVGAGALLGGLGGAVAGTFGGVAAAGATTAAVTAFGVASTGTAISTLSGAAATNAVLAALGGGSLAAGGGGIALGTAVLGISATGIALLAGGVIFGLVGKTMSEKADNAMRTAMEISNTVDKECKYLAKLSQYAKKMTTSLNQVNRLYVKHLDILSYIIKGGKTEWKDFTSDERLITQNTVLLVNTLYDMCKVRLVHKSESEGEYNEINESGINSALDEAKKVSDRLNAE